jgi:hypothetical protein
MNIQLFDAQAGFGGSEPGDKKLVTARSGSRR